MLDLEQFSNQISRELGGLQMAVKLLEEKSLKSLEEKINLKLCIIEDLLHKSISNFESFQKSCAIKNAKYTKEQEDIKIKVYTISACIAGLVGIITWIAQKLLRI